ncbi:MAG: hypothetical protein UGF43_15170 [Blautia sp.]|uniref:hypothetical protein n=1 Tax=Blautia sp. TaxID=1955243 RepID=UPI002E77D676|nr:hypothetical protein [Blautia sp.]MEE1444931.1 hypothetical protein [Blautia sp.]
MKIMKILLTITTILFAGFGLFKVLSFDIANPIMLVSLATLLLLRGIEYKNNRDPNGFILNLIVAMFVYVVVIYNVFLS